MVRMVPRNDPHRWARREAFLRPLTAGQEGALLTDATLMTVVSFDRDFDRFPGVLRREP